MILVNFEKELPEFTVRAALLIEPRTTVILRGESGAGKTTILECVAGLVRPDRGEIVIDERTVFSSSRGICLPPRERGTGYVFQHYALFPHMNVLENVAFAMKKEERARAGRFLERMRIDHLAKRRPNDLSGGERQRLALARALAIGPRVLLLDEPFSALDRRTREEVGREFLALREELGMSVILVTHDRRDADIFGQRVYEVVDGQVGE